MLALPGGGTIAYNSVGNLVDSAQSQLERHIVHMDLPDGMHIQAPACRPSSLFSLDATRRRRFQLTGGHAQSRSVESCKFDACGEQCKLMPQHASLRRMAMEGRQHATQDLQAHFGESGIVAARAALSHGQGGACRASDRNDVSWRQRAQHFDSRPTSALRCARPRALHFGVRTQVIRWSRHVNVRITMSPIAGGQDLAMHPWLLTGSGGSRADGGC